MLNHLTLDQLRAILEARKLEQTFETRALTQRESRRLKNYKRILGAGAGRVRAVVPVDPLDDIPSSAIFAELRSRQKAIYGEDDRVDVINCTDPLRCERARSVAAIVERKNLVALGEGQVSIGGSTLEQRLALAGKPLCKREAFRAQHCAALGSAFLVAPNIIATAHHCVNERTFAARCLLFDFQTGADGAAPTRFHVDQLYAFSRYLTGAFSPDGADWALIELDRPVVDRSALPLASGGSAVDLLPLYVIGHPSGLPKKIAGNAEIRVNTAPTHFVANLDTFGGNSGSPVFNALSHEVEGILVRGDTDFVPLGDCYASLICPITGCRGEECARIGPIVEFLAAQTHGPGKRGHSPWIS